MSLEHLNETGKHLGDVVSIGWLVAIFFDWLPGITAILVAVWTIMRMVESWQAIKLNRRKLQSPE